jgi:glycerol dehydrogenase
VQLEAFPSRRATCRRSTSEGSDLELWKGGPALERQVGPRLYSRGSGAIAALAKCSSIYGKQCLVIGGKTALARAGVLVTAALTDAGATATETVWYGGECSEDCVNALLLRVTQSQIKLLVGVGGGKALDTAKLVASRTKIPVLTVPTIAATCAAWTPVSALYTAAGEYIDLVPSVAPLLVAADTGVIGRAPLRYLVSGIGDTLAKRYELEASTAAAGPSDAAAVAGALALGRACFQVLADSGRQAIAEVSQGNCDGIALGNVVEAVIMLAGTVSELGGDAGRTAAAHAIYSGLSYLPESHVKCHGELVAFGILAQLCLEGRADVYVKEYLKVSHDAGLPMTLAECGLGELGEDALWRAAEISVQIRDMDNMPIRVTAEMVYRAIKDADRHGQAYLDS